jgi:hypothetical protein
MVLIGPVAIYRPAAESSLKIPVGVLMEGNFITHLCQEFRQGVEVSFQAPDNWFLTIPGQQVGCKNGYLPVQGVSPRFFSISCTHVNLCVCSTDSYQKPFLILQIRKGFKSFNLL